MTTTLNVHAVLHLKILRKSWKVYHENQFVEPNDKIYSPQLLEALQ